MSRAPEAMTVPEFIQALAEAEFLLHPLPMPLVAAEQADQQVGAGRWRMSVAPHFGQWLRPSFNSAAAVSMATGSGASNSSRIGSGRVAGSMG
jgi:hypothetical protein